MHEEKSESPSPEPEGQSGTGVKLWLRRRMAGSDSGPAEDKEASAEKTSKVSEESDALPLSSQVPCLQLGGRQRRMAAAVGGILLLAALFLRLSSFVFALAGALLLNSFTWSLATRMRRRGLSPLAAIIIVYGLSVTIVALLFLAVTPAWQRSGEIYAGHLVAATESLSSRLIAPAEEPAEADTDTDPGFSEQLIDGSRRIIEQAPAAVEWGMELLLQPTSFVAANRVRLFFQVSLLLALIVFPPIILGNDLADPNDRLQRILALPHRLTRWLMTKFGSGLSRRLSKALIPAILVGAGIKLAGLEVGFFLAVISFVLSLFIAWGGMVGIVLSAPAVLAEPFVLRPLFVLGSALIILFFLERYLHRRLVSRFRSRGRSAGDAGGFESYSTPGGRGVNWGGWLRSAIYIFILLGIGYVLYILIPPLLAQRQLQQRLDGGQSLLADGSYSAAAEKFSAILEEHPEESRAVLGLVKAHTLSDSPGIALEYAEKLDALADRPEAAPGGLREQAVNYVVNLVYSPSRVDPVEAYEFIEENVFHLDYPELIETVRRRLRQAD